MTIQLWAINSVAITQNSQDLESEDQFPHVLVPASNSGTTRETQIVFQTNQMRCLTLLSLPPCQQPPIRAYIPLFSSTIKLSHFPACLGVSADKSHGGGLTCHSKLWINSLCVFPFGRSSFIPTCSNLNAGKFTASASRSLGFVKKILIYFHNFQADGNRELGRVEMGMHRFWTSHYW